MSFKITLQIANMKRKLEFTLVRVDGDKAHMQADKRYFVVDLTNGQGYINHSNMQNRQPTLQDAQNRPETFYLHRDVVDQIKSHINPQGSNDPLFMVAYCILITMESGSAYTMDKYRNFDQREAAKTFYDELCEGKHMPENGSLYNAQYGRVLDSTDHKG